MKRYSSYLRTHVPVLFVLVAFASFGVSAQLPTATILGTVKDSTGGAVGGATVTVTDTDTGVSRNAPTGDDGSYRFPALPVDHYEVKVMKEGFQITTRTGITLTVGQDATIDVTLQVGSTSQTVEVTGEAPIVDTTSSSTGNVINDQAMTDLPLNGRSWTDLTLMQPGITQVNVFSSFAGIGAAIGVPGDNGQVYSSNGGTIRSNVYLLDGADERTMMGVSASSVLETTLGVDGIKEYKVVSILPSAEYGLVAGGQTTTVSKGGTNQWHGDAFEYLRNASLDANPYNTTLDTTNFNGCGTDKLFSFPCKRVAPFQRNNFGGAGGGPIQKDKTFFYAVFEGLVQRTGQAATFNTLPTACFVDPSNGQPLAVKPDGTPANLSIKGVIPSTIASNGCVIGSQTSPITVSNPALVTLANINFPEPNIPLTSATRSANYEAFYTVPGSEQYGQIRFDHTFSASDSGFFRYTQDDSTSVPLIGSDPRIANTNHSGEHFGTISETHIFTPTLLNTARLSYSRFIIDQIPSTLDTSIPGLPNKPINSTTLLVTDSSNQYMQPGAESPGQIPQLPIPGCAPVSSSACWSTYGSAPVSASGSGGVSDSNNYTFSDDIYWTKGRHAFKFGTLINRYDWIVAGLFNSTGSLVFPGVNTPTSATVCANAQSCPLAAYFEGVYSSITRAGPNSNFQRQFRTYTYGFYAQDDLKASKRLTLNLGFRYELATVPRELNSALAFTLRFPATDATGTAGNMFTNPSLHNFSPRIGFAWDVFGDGKTSVRGGAGLYYDVGEYGNLELSNSIAVPTNVPGGYISNSITYTDPNLVGVTCCTAANATGNNSSTQGHIADVQPFSVPLPNVANTAVTSPRTVQYNIDQPTFLQRSLGVDHQLPGNMALSVTYVGSRAWHLYQEREGDPEAWYPAMTQPATACNPLTGPAFTCNGVVTAVPVVNGSAVCSSSTAGCNPVMFGPNGLPYYCSPADGTSGPPTAAHPCFSNAATIPCTTTATAKVTTPTCPARANPAFAQVFDVTTSGDSYYNSLQVLLNKRTSHGLQLQLNYTWQKLLDTGTGQGNSENSVNPHEYPIAGGGPNGTIDRGPSAYNATDNIRANFVYRVPDFVKSESLLGKFVNGWGISAITSYQTGYPQSVTISGDRTLYNAMLVTERPDLCPNYSAADFKSTATYTGNRATSTAFNINMICLPVAGTLGNSPKGLFTAPGLWGDNVSFTKDTKAKFLGEAGNIQFRFDLFNAINHPNFNPPSGSIFTASSSQFPQGGSIAQLQAAGGAIASQVNSGAGLDSLSTLTQMRQMQVSLRLVF